MLKKISKSSLIYLLIILIFTCFLSSVVPPGIFKIGIIFFPILMYGALQSKTKISVYGFTLGALIIHHWLLNAIVTYKTIDADTFTPLIINSGFFYAPVLPNPFISIFMVATLVIHFVSFNNGNVSILIYEKITVSILIALISSLGIQFLRKLSIERNRFYKASITDPLTGLSTFTNAVILGQKLLDTGNKLIVILIDLDNFKTINDTYGHFVGNKVLLQFSCITKICVVKINNCPLRWR